MYMIFLFFFYQVTSGMLSGPVWGSYLKWPDMCDDYHWVPNVFLVDNWFGNVVKGTYCMPWGWYISTDF